MSAAAAPLPPRRPGPMATGWLTPRSWHLADEPPTLESRRPTDAGSQAPWLLLLDRRRPLARERTEELSACLSSEERQRHQASRLPADRQRFLLARAALRLLLGTWLELPPEAVPLETGPHGKPSCPIGPCFNLSHSGDLILLALHPAQPVGVDVEQLRAGLDWPPIARRMFSEAERLALEQRPAPERPEAFLATWCRLEARLKAHGTGLAGLERLRGRERPEEEPGPGPSAPDGEQRSGGSGAGGERVWDVQVPAGYRAAVALASGAPG